MGSKRKKESAELKETIGATNFPGEVLERVLGLVKSHKDRSSVSVACKEWYNAERWSRSHVFIGNCYSVSPEIVTRSSQIFGAWPLKGNLVFRTLIWFLPTGVPMFTHGCRFLRLSTQILRSLGLREWLLVMKAWSFWLFHSQSLKLSPFWAVMGSALMA